MKTYDRRVEIAEAAMPLFADRGYYGTGMQDIAAAIGIKASSLYNHYSSKHEILAFIMTTAMTDMLNTHARCLAGMHTPTEKLGATVATHMEFHAHRRLETQITNREISHLKDPDRTQLRRMRKDYVNRWIEIITEGMETGEFTCEDPKITAYALIDMGIGVCNWYRPDGQVELEILKVIYKEMALRMVGGK